jgi:crotonobetainyl-CoA:carnitine CoA-transferase CaiB-like acyl-CoA transferase
VRQRKALDELINAVFDRLTAAEVLDRLECAEIANARVGSVADFIDHPQLSARRRWRAIDSPAGPVETLLPPVQMSGADAVMGAVPALGEHTNAILGELGFADDVVASWRSQGVI